MLAKTRRIVSLLVVALLLVPGTAFGWSNGPSYGEGFGTHDWVVYRANVIAAGRGATWVNVSVAMSASDDPDTTLHDTYYHVYDIWGSTYGNSPVKVEACYTNAVNALKVGDTSSASYWIGLLSHYYSDTCNPLHTDQTEAEDSVHSAYENAVDDETVSATSLLGIIYDNGHAHVADPAALTRSAAAIAHGNYNQLVSGWPAGRLGNANVRAITDYHLNQAVNDVADIIMSIQEDAFPFVPQPNAVYRFYRPASGTHFYTPDAAEATSVISRLSATYRYEGIAYYADPAKNSSQLYRFYRPATGTHFYTADPAEKANVQYNLSGTYSFDGPTYTVQTSGSDGGAPVYRFYNSRAGTHFYSADPAEVASVRANLGHIYTYEGAAFWLGQ